MDASKVALTGTVKNITKTEKGTLFVGIETVTPVKTLPPLRFVVNVKNIIADSIRCREGDYVAVIGGTIYSVKPDGTIMIAVKEPNRVLTCAKDDGFVDAAEELL